MAHLAGINVRLASSSSFFHLHLSSPLLSRSVIPPPPSSLRAENTANCQAAADYRAGVKARRGDRGKYILISPRSPRFILCLVKPANGKYAYIELELDTLLVRKIEWLKLPGNSRRNCTQASLVKKLNISHSSLFGRSRVYFYTRTPLADPWSCTTHLSTHQNIDVIGL